MQTFRSRIKCTYFLYNITFATQRNQIYFYIICSRSADVEIGQQNIGKQDVFKIPFSYIMCRYIAWQTLD